MIDEILKRMGLKYEDLNVAERETLHSWLSALSKNDLTIARVREYIASMRESVENELTKAGHETNQDLLLKARLRNYVLLEAFLTSPERAKRQLEGAISAMANLRK